MIGMTENEREQYAQLRAQVLAQDILLTRLLFLLGHKFRRDGFGGLENRDLRDLLIKSLEAAEEQMRAGDTDTQVTADRARGIILDIIAGPLSSFGESIPPHLFG